VRSRRKEINVAVGVSRIQRCAPSAEPINVAPVGEPINFAASRRSRSTLRRRRSRSKVAPSAETHQRLRLRLDRFLGTANRGGPGRVIRLSPAIPRHSSSGSRQYCSVGAVGGNALGHPGAARVDAIWWRGHDGGGPRGRGDRRAHRIPVGAYEYGQELGNLGRRDARRPAWPGTWMGLDSLAGRPAASP